MRLTRWNPSHARRAVCLWLPNWPIQRWRAEQSVEAAEEATLLLSAPGRRGLVVAACSDDLAAQGATPGMALAEAQALSSSQRARRATVIEHDAAADRRALMRLAQSCYEFSPQVATADDCADAIWLDVTGLAHLYGDEQQLLATIAASMVRRGWTCRLALADSYAAAWALARYRAEAGSPLLVAPSEMKQAIAELPVEALRASEQVVANLWKLGLRRVGQVAALPRSAVAASLEPAVVRRLDGLHAMAPEALRAAPRVEGWEASTSWDLPLEDATVLGRELERLLIGLAERLARRNLGATLLHVRLDCLPADSLAFDLRLFCPSCDARLWLELALLQLERQRLRAGVITLTVRAQQVVVRPQQQLTFLANDNTDTADAQRAQLLARLTSRLGPEAVSRPELRPDVQPERSWRRQPIAHRRRRKAGREEAKAAWPERPTSLLPKAQHLTMTVGAGDRCLAAFQWHGRQLQVARSWGPERIETGWWRGQPAQRDYYRVELTDGRRAWLFHRLVDERWFLHGWFD